MATPPISTSPKDSPFDAIVVGSGAGGAPLAARLAEYGWRVLVLEAGPEQAPKTPEHEITQVPVLHGPSTEHPEVSWRFFVKHYDHAAEADPKWHPRPEVYPKGDGIFYPRATGIGGCTIHNALITIAGPDGDWDEMAWFLNDATWRAETMRTYFERIECCEFLEGPPRFARTFRGRFWENVRWLFGQEIDPTGGRHGYKGWLHTSRADLQIGFNDRQLLDMIFAAKKTSKRAGMDSLLRFVKALWKGRIFADLDPNHARRQAKHPEGLALVPEAIYGPKTQAKSKRGHRSSPRERLLKAREELEERRRIESQKPPEKRKPVGEIVIATDCFVTKVLIEDDGNGGKKAVGIEYLHGPKLYRATPGASRGAGKPGRIHAKKEVILAGGAFNTPQLLMLSGVGPEDHLVANGIKCLVNSPGVGCNLQDRYEVTVVSQMARNFEALEGATLKLPVSPAPADRHLEQWRQDGRGLYSSNGAVIGILKRSRPELAQPDLFIFGLPLKFKGYAINYSDVKERDLFTWAVLKAHTCNRDGVVRLRSSDPLDTPEINFHYFQEISKPGGNDPDLEAVLNGVKFVREIAAQAGVKESYPRNESDPNVGDAFLSDEALRNWIKRDAWGHHACGTCRMGRSTDPKAVLDSQFRVLDKANGGERRRPIQGLRVVDASMFWKIPGYFIVTNIYMASEKAADVIRDAWPS
jgi:choline dehydrogenase